MQEFLEPRNILTRRVDLRAGEGGEGGCAEEDRAVGVTLDGWAAGEGRGLATVDRELDGFRGRGGGDGGDEYYDGDGDSCDAH